VLTKKAAEKAEKAWGRFLWAPSVYWTVMKEADFVPLRDLGNVTRGLTTGANDFFYFQEEQDWMGWDIDPKFIRPLLKHHAEMEFTSLKSDELTWSVLDVNWFIEKHFNGNPGAKDVKDKLEEEGYANLKTYIEWGEREGHNEGATVQTREPWFNLGEIEGPPLGLIEVYWRDLRTVYNEARAAFDKRQYCMWPGGGIDEKVLAGILNSSLYGLMRELHGRTEQGQAMNRNTMMVYEAKNLPTPNPRAMKESEREEIKYAFESLIEAERSATEDTPEAKDRLDRAVMSAIGMEDRTEDVQEAVELLLRVREEGAGQMTDVLVKSGEEMDSSLKGARRVEGNRGQMELEL